MKTLIIISLIVVILVLLATNADRRREIKELEYKVKVLEFDLEFERDPELSRCIGYCDPGPELQRIIREIKIRRLKRDAADN